MICDLAQVALAVFGLPGLALLFWLDRQRGLI
jgi:hypothetical protein